MKNRYGVATGNGRISRGYFLRSTARHVFNRLPLAPGEAAVLARRRRNGAVEILDERFGFSSSEDKQ